MEVVDAIRTAAAQVLVRHGYARATTNRIAETAGVSIGTLYQYFDGKDAVFEELAQHFLDAIAEAVVTSIVRTAELSLEDRVRALAESGAAVLARHPGLLRALDAAPGTSFRPRLEQTRAVARDALENLLASDGAPSGATLRRRARLFVSMAEGAALDVGPDDDIAELADEVTHLVLAYAKRR